MVGLCNHHSFDQNDQADHLLHMHKLNHVPLRFPSLAHHLQLEYSHHCILVHLCCTPKSEQQKLQSDHSHLQAHSSRNQKCTTRSLPLNRLQMPSNFHIGPGCESLPHHPGGNIQESWCEDQWTRFGHQVAISFLVILLEATNLAHIQTPCTTTILQMF